MILLLKLHVYLFRKGKFFFFFCGMHARMTFVLCSIKQENIKFALVPIYYSI